MTYKTILDQAHQNTRTRNPISLWIIPSNLQGHLKRVKMTLSSRPHTKMKNLKITKLWLKNLRWNTKNSLVYLKAMKMVTSNRCFWLLNVSRILHLTSPFIIRRLKKFRKYKMRKATETRWSFKKVKNLTKRTTRVRLFSKRKKRFICLLMWSSYQSRTFMLSKPQNISHGLRKLKVNSIRFLSGIL